MNKKIFFVLALVFVILISGIFFYSNSGEEENSPNYHTCNFDKNSLDINCSSELRIKEGYERFLTEEPLNLSDNTIAYYYDNPIYSENSNSNLNTIYKTSSDLYITNTDGEKYRQCSDCEIPTNRQSSDFFDEPGLFQFREIEVIDLSENRTFSFYVSDSGVYDVEKDNSIGLIIDLCKANENTVCMPEQHWRCWNYDITAKACDSLVSFKNVNNCYDLEKENLVAYCLARVDMNKCMEYTETNSEFRKICDTINCQNDNGNVQECLDTYYSE